MNGQCGTYAGWNAHNRRGEAPCVECRRANADYQAAWRFRIGRMREPLRCRECGSVFRDHRCGMASQ